MSTNSAYFVSSEGLGIYEQEAERVAKALARPSPIERTKVDRYTVLDLDTDPEFPEQGQSKKIYYCVTESLKQAGEFTMHLALRSSIENLNWQKEKKVFQILKDTQRTIQPRLIQTEGGFDYLIVDLANQGDLYVGLTQKKIIPNSLQARILSCLLVSAVLEFHAKGVIHCDLKLENILVTEENNRWDLKITDFGFAFLLDEDSYEKAIHPSGSPDYISEEDWTVFARAEKLLPADYGRDIWALSVVLYVLATGRSPAEAKTNQQGKRYLELVPRGQVSGIFSTIIEDLVFGDRRGLPSLGEIQQQMLTILKQTYPKEKRVQELQPISTIPNAIARWEKEGIEKFVESADARIVRLIHEFAVG